jgi:hypothetical protein
VSVDRNRRVAETDNGGGGQAVEGKAKWRKRGVLNFMGELSKILFGTMDEAEARYYNEQSYSSKTQKTQPL